MNLDQGDNIFSFAIIMCRLRSTAKSSEGFIQIDSSEGELYIENISGCFVLGAHWPCQPALAPIELTLSPHQSS